MDRLKEIDVAKLDDAFTMVFVFISMIINVAFMIYAERRMNRMEEKIKNN